MKFQIGGLRRRIHRASRQWIFSKRQQFVAITIVLTAGLVFTQLVPPEFRYAMVVGVAFLAYIACAVVLREDLKGAEWLTLLTLPTLFTMAVTLFYFLLPVRWLTRLPAAAFYGVGIYAILLTENIYNVAAERSIALLRAAHSVGFLLTLVTYFLLVQAIFAFRFVAPIQTVLVAIISFVLILQALWAMELGKGIGVRVLRLTAGFALVLAELTWTLSFWPVATTLQVLFLTACLYGLTAIGQLYVMEKLYKKTVTEFFIVCTVVFILLLLSTRWRGSL